MIRKQKPSDLNRILDIWLNVNIEAHSFIDKNYWISNFDIVKDLIPDSDIYVYEKDEDILGFIGINNGKIEGIFVDSKFQSQGIGHNLITKAKSLYKSLCLNVYELNKNAINFYIREGFIIKEHSFDTDNNAKELIMIWNKN